MKKHWLDILIAVLLILGVALLLYPAFSNYVHSRNVAKIITDYNRVSSDTSEERKLQMIKDAEDYNAKLAKTPQNFYDPSQVTGYNKTLDLTGTGIMGYINIPKIDVELPIYHGTEKGVLQVGVGHLEGSSLPVGGKSTHAVLSGHRGLPSSRLFTDLDEIETGDTFTITVMDRVITYKVDQIKIVLPEEIEDLYIEDGMDYCTLVTCTPYGVNTHRLLVRGVRTDEGIDKPAGIAVSSEAIKIDTALVATAVAGPAFIVVVAVIVIVERRRTGHGKQK